MTADSTQRVLVIPAAGAGSRLGSVLPKFLTKVGGVTMLGRLVALYEPYVRRFVVIVGPEWPGAARAAMERLTEAPCAVAVQERPTGMLDAVLLARPAVEAAPVDRVWITWCDQVAVHPDTVARLAGERRDQLLTMPVVVRTEPYIHFDRDVDGRIAGVRQRREGDRMPAIGESDAGVFSLSREAFLRGLPAYADDLPSGAVTGERNLLPFIPWLAARGDVATLPCLDDMEALGINTPGELKQVEAYLAARAG